MRISARLDDEYMSKLELLKKQNQLSTTAVIKLAIDTLYALRMPKSGGTIQELLASDFVGIWKGPKDGSVNYKKYVIEYLDEKASSSLENDNSFNNLQLPDD